MCGESCMHGVEWGKIRRLLQRITYHYRTPRPWVGSITHRTQQTRPAALPTGSWNWTTSSAATFKRFWRSVIRRWTTATAVRCSMRPPRCSFGRSFPIVGTTQTLKPAQITDCTAMFTPYWAQTSRAVMTAF